MITLFRVWVSVSLYIIGGRFLYSVFISRLVLIREIALRMLTCPYTCLLSLTVFMCVRYIILVREAYILRMHIIYTILARVGHSSSSKSSFISVVGLVVQICYFSGIYHSC